MAGGGQRCVPEADDAQRCTLVIRNEVVPETTCRRLAPVRRAVPVDHAGSRAAGRINHTPAAAV